jgi:hypothetical protein
MNDKTLPGSPACGRGASLWQYSGERSSETFKGAVLSSPERLPFARHLEAGLCAGRCKGFPAHPKPFGTFFMETWLFNKKKAGFRVAHEHEE